MMSAESDPVTELPTELTLTNCAMAMDGGSLLLRALDQSGVEVELYLDWSVRRQMEKTTQLFANSRLVPRGSPEEARWLALVGRAAIQRPSAPSTPAGTTISRNCVVLADDAAEYISAIEQGPEVAISCLATRFISLVSSAAYQEGHAPSEPPSPPPDRVRSLVMEGKTVEAIKVHREAHPEVGLMEASRTVKALVAEIEAASGLSGNDP